MNFAIITAKDTELISEAAKESLHTPRIPASASYCVRLTKSYVWLFSKSLQLRVDTQVSALESASQKPVRNSSA